MSEEAANKNDPVWLQGHVAHASMQLGSQPLTELKLFMHPKPTMHPHLSQERPPAGKPPAKGETAQVFWVKSDQAPQPIPAVKDNKIKEHDMSSSESQESDSPSMAGGSAGSRPPRPHSAERQYKCKDCGKAFPQPSHLIRHTRTHTGEQPYKCDLCGRAFSDQSHRLRHLRTHIGVRTHKCDECGKEFFEPNHLVRHTRRHTGERPFPCDQCGKAFCEQSGLNRHLRTHSGERPFKCEFCGRGFAQRSELVRHAGTHTGNRLHKCEVCDKSFSDRSGLSKHSRTHVKTPQTQSWPSNLQRQQQSQPQPAQHHQLPQATQPPQP